MNMAMDFEEDTKSLGDYLKVFKRRKKQFFIPAAITLVIVVLAALLWPPTYRSTATILIEQQEIPKDLVQSTVTSLANQQIQEITQRILTLKNIMDMVKKYNLYDEDILRTKPRTEIAQEFQKAMTLELVSAEVIDPRSGRPSTATIAFTLAFDHRDPASAQQVANELVNLYLNENLKSRTEKSASASAFLREEAKAMGGRLSELEAQIATFKEQNEGSLPELYQYNLSLIDRTERELLDISFRIKELEKRALELEAQKAPLSPYAPTVLPSGENVLSDYDRLKSLQSEYRRKSAVYSKDHPDIQRLQREINNLEANIGSLSRDDYAKQLRTEQETLSGLKQRYTADHPEVVNQERVIAQLEERLANAPSKATEPQAADNPAYVLLDTQLQSARGEINSLRKKEDELRSKIAQFESYILRAPAVERDYKTLLRDYDNAQLKYREIKAKQMQADLSQNLEQDRKGERFTLIDPPVRPEEPVSPNRLALLIVGLILSGGIGVGAIALMEALDENVRGQKSLETIIGGPLLVSVPYIHIDAELQQDNRRLYIMLGAAAAAVIVVLVLFHFLVKPLDVTYYILLNKLGVG